MAEAPPTEAIATTLGIISKPLHVKLLQTAAMTLAAFVGGQTATVSFLTVPSILQTPSASLLARQWRTFFDRGLIMGPGCIMPSSIIFGWLALREPSLRTQSFKLYSVASALLLGTVPYTMLLVNPTNAELKKRSDEAAQADVESGGRTSTTGTQDLAKNHANLLYRVDVKQSYNSQTTGQFIQNQYGSDAAKPEQQSTHRLVDNWALLNVGRGAMCIVAGLCGTWATISEDLSFFEYI